MTLQAQRVKERPANWLPLPGEGDEPAVHQAMVDENDLFAKATVVSYHSLQGEGTLRTPKGDLLPFNIAQGAVAGDPRYLKPGTTVGFDASVTSHGMRVIALKVY
ncbi:MAG: hypothetical protein JXA24_01595 [Proteobacteria bacterium]|nr:hypothetical protein [Pseudomonadota bacterium]